MNHDLETDLAALLNSYSAENASNTPDFIVAHYLIGCLDVYAKTVKARDSWHGTMTFQDALAAPVGSPEPGAAPHE